MMYTTSFGNGNTSRLTFLYFICWFINSLHSVISEDDKEVIVHRIGGIFSRRSSAPYLAAQMAINNIQHGDDIEGRSFFQPVFLNCGDEEKVKEAMMSNPDVRIWLAGCQQDCLALAELTHVQNRTDIIILCYGITALSVDDLENYKNLFSLESNAYSVAYTFAKIILRCKWDNIAVIYQHESSSDIIYSSIGKELIGALEIGSDKRINTSVIEDDTLEVVKFLEEVQPSIIVSLCDAATAKRILCNIHVRKLFGGEHIWMFTGTYPYEWYKPFQYEYLGCSFETMRELVYGHLTAKSLNWNHDLNQVTASGQTIVDFEQQLLSELKRVGGHYIRTDNDEAALAYDAIWASLVSLPEEIARRESLDGNYSFPNHVDLNSIMKNVSFSGISGDFSFNSYRKRSIANAVVQIDIYVDNKYKWCGQHIYGTSNGHFEDSCCLPSYRATTTVTPPSLAPSSTVYATKIDYGLILICSVAFVLNIT